MLIAIKSCVAHKDREIVQRDTWATSHTVWLHGPLLGVPDSYEELPKKTQAMCLLLSHQDYAFFADTDTYIALDRLLAYPYQLHDYIGRCYDMGLCLRWRGIFSVSEGYAHLGGGRAP